MSNILFLDVDGVLNSVYGIKTKNPHGSMGIEDALAEKMKHLIRSTDVKVVLCSTWRLYDDLTQDVIEKLDLGDRYIGKTCQWPWDNNWDKNLDERQFEIEKWIDDHPEINSWICLDDCDYPINRSKGFKVNCDSSVGVSDSQVDIMIRFFNKKGNT